MNSQIIIINKRHKPIPNFIDCELFCGDNTTIDIDSSDYEVKKLLVYANPQAPLFKTLILADMPIPVFISSIFSAFLLNIFFNFLTKKFPKPFEKIGYICSVDFFKDIFKKVKGFFIQAK